MPNDSTDEYRRTKDRARARLEHALTGNAEVLRRINENQAGWSPNLFQEAGEASAPFTPLSLANRSPSAVQAPIRPAPKKRPAVEQEARSAATAPTTDSIV